MLYRKKTTHCSLDGTETQSLFLRQVVAYSRMYLHIWWGCDIISSFWNKIFRIYNEIYSESCPIIGNCSITLSILLGSLRSQKASLLSFFFLSAHQLISRYLKSSSTPTFPLTQWVDIINNTMQIEESLARDSDNCEKCKVFWVV